MRDLQVEQLVSVTLAGASFVLFTQLATRTDLAGTLLLSWFLLAACIPFLCAFALEPFPEVPGREKFDLFIVYSYFTVFILDVLAVTLVFEHLARGAGLLFALSSVFAYAFLRRAVRARRKKDE